MRVITNVKPPTSTPTEWSEVERPPLLQLAGMGWKVILGDIDVPELTERESFRQVVLYPRLREAIRSINEDDGPVDELTIDRAIRALEATGGQSLIEKNRMLTERLIKGVKVEPTDPGAQRQRLIRFIEFDPAKQDRNDFVAINQYRVDLPGPGTFVIPDVVLFVNGLPLVVVECKSPAITDPRYLILHELVHLHEHNHSPAFYRRLGRAEPDYAEKEAWLEAHGDAYAL